MTKYQELESQIEQLQKEVERLKEEEKAKQIDLSTCIVGQLVELRNGQFDCYEYNGDDYYVIGGIAYDKNGNVYGSSFESEHDVVKVFPNEIPLPGAFSSHKAKKVLKGDVSALGLSFGFADTPQGDKYWRDIFTGKTKLSLGDMIFIQKWVIQSV
jgi:hypothetical protein